MHNGRIPSKKRILKGNQIMNDRDSLIQALAYILMAIVIIAIATIANFHCRSESNPETNYIDTNKTTNERETEWTVTPTTAK